jgi:hypothetical protein
MNASSFLGYGIIGTSDGFAAQTAGLLADMDIGSIVDLDNRQIFAPYDTEILAGIRQERDGHWYTYFVLYRYAVEQERSRTGAYYGSVVALKDCTADGFAIYNLLLELATNVKVYLDPDTRRFLVPMEDISFLHPDSIDEVVRSIKKQSVGAFEPKGYFAPLPLHPRNSFRFIDFFQNKEEAVERFFVSNDQEVVALVKNKAGLEMKNLVLENAAVEQKLEQADRIDSEVFIKEKELESLREQHALASDKLTELEQQAHEWNDQLNSLNSATEQLKQQRRRLEEDLKHLETTKSELIRTCRSLEVRLEKLPEYPSKKEEKVSKKESLTAFNLQEQMKALHPLTRMFILVLFFISLSTVGYLTVTGFGHYQPAKSRGVQGAPPLDEFSKLEQQINEEYLVFDKTLQDSFLARLAPFLSDEQASVRKKAAQLQRYILLLGYQYYQQELKRTDTIPVLHGQLVEEFEILKSKYDSIFISVKQ